MNERLHSLVLALVALGVVLCFEKTGHAATSDDAGRSLITPAALLSVLAPVWLLNRVS